MDKLEQDICFSHRKDSGQSKKASMAEAATNILIGYGVNLAANFTIFPYYGWEISLKQNLTIGVFFTIVSFVRSYCLRRLYNLVHLWSKES